MSRDLKKIYKLSEFSILKMMGEYEAEVEKELLVMRFHAAGRLDQNIEVVLRGR